MKGYKIIQGKRIVNNQGPDGSQPLCTEVKDKGLDFKCELGA